MKKPKGKIKFSELLGGLLVVATLPFLIVLCSMLRTDGLPALGNKHYWLNHNSANFGYAENALLKISSLDKGDVGDCIVYAAGNGFCIGEKRLELSKKDGNYVAIDESGEGNSVQIVPADNVVGIVIGQDVIVGKIVSFLAEIRFVGVMICLLVSLVVFLEIVVSIIRQLTKPKDKESDSL